MKIILNLTTPLPSSSATSPSYTPHLPAQDPDHPSLALNSITTPEELSTGAIPITIISILSLLILPISPNLSKITRIESLSSSGFSRPTFSNLISASSLSSGSRTVAQARHSHSYQELSTRL